MSKILTQCFVSSENQAFTVLANSVDVAGTAIFCIIKETLRNSIKNLI